MFERGEIEVGGLRKWGIGGKGIKVGGGEEMEFGGR